MKSKTFIVTLKDINHSQPIPVDAQTIKEWLEGCHTVGLIIEVEETKPKEVK